MRNYISPGNAVTVTAPYALTSGDGALVGSLFGIAATTAGNGATVELVTTGVFEMKKTAAQEWTLGTKVYWDNTAKECTSVATDNTLIGVSVKAAANPSTTGRVRLGIVA